MWLFDIQLYNAYIDKRHRKNKSFSETKKEKHTQGKEEMDSLRQVLEQLVHWQVGLLILDLHYDH